jgi:hypothetical protein
VTDFIFEDPPRKIARRSDANPHREFLTALKEHPNRSARVTSADGIDLTEKQANTLAGSMRSIAVTVGGEWSIVARRIPGTETYGVWAKFVVVDAVLNDASENSRNVSTYDADGGLVPDKHGEDETGLYVSGTATYRAEDIHPVPGLPEGEPVGAVIESVTNHPWDGGRAINDYAGINDYTGMPEAEQIPVGAERVSGPWDGTAVERAAQAAREAAAPTTLPGHVADHTL